MESPRQHPLTLLSILTAATCVMAFAGLAAVQEVPPTVRQKAMDPVPSVQGRYNFVAYCASCHGPDGKGHGPVVPALKQPVPDLTTITRRHGKFDAIAIERVIAGEDRMPAAHGSLEMPVWGPVFKGTVGNASATLRMRNLVKYLQSIQQNPT